MARAAAEEITKGWRAELKATFKTDQLPATPGTPDLAWVSVTGTVTDGDYRALWDSVQQEMVGRRRARVFEPFEISGSRLCAQSPGLPAVAAPRGKPAHERKEALSAASWVKRHAASQRFPSTVSIASSAFRSRLLELAGADPAVAAELCAPVEKLTAVLDRLQLHTDRAKLRSVQPPPGLEALAGLLGAWVTPERWDTSGIGREYGTEPDEQTVRDGRAAASALAAIARKAAIPAPSPYYAIVVQDFDRLGRALGRLDLDQQRTVSQQLSELAEEQSVLLRDKHPLAERVYAGDDLLALCPAAEALQLAESIRQQVRAAVATGPLATAGPEASPITASTGVVFAYMSNPLQDAIRSAQQAIAEAKSATRARGRSRDAIAVVVRRRGGQRARTVQPWWPAADLKGASATELLNRIKPGPGVAALSAGLGSDLERDEAMLAELAGEQELLRAELVRLVTRHGGTPEAGEALCTLGLSERAIPQGSFEPVPAALVARFLFQEAR
jgi:hypothetical protein